MRASRSDYILRLIEQLGAAIARLREKLVGAGAAAADEVMDETRQMQSELFGPLWEVISRVDARTAASLVPEQNKLLVWIELLEIEADAAEKAGAAATAAARRLRAAELRNEMGARVTVDASRQISG